MFTQTDKVDAHLIGHHRLFHDIAQNLIRPLQCAIRPQRYIAKGIDPKFHHTQSSASETTLSAIVPAGNGA